nr:sugar phosphate isomerase/epimerase [Clostridia bacterium]
MITGIQLSSIKKYMQTEADVRTSLARLAEIGYRTAQLQWHGMDIPVSAVANALKDCGITAVSVQDYTHVVLDDPDYYISLADACQFTDITISGIPSEELTADGIRRFAERISPFHRRLTAEGRTLSFHPRWQELVDIDGKTVLERLLEESDPAIKVLPDVNHIVRAGYDTPAFIASLKGRISMLHAKDMTDANREASHLTPVGQGCVDWKPILTAAADAGVRYVFAEQESWDKDAFLCMRESFEYLTGIIGG